MATLSVHKSIDSGKKQQKRQIQDLTSLSISVLVLLTMTVMVGKRRVHNFATLLLLAKINPKLAIVGQTGTVGAVGCQ